MGAQNRMKKHTIQSQVATELVVGAFMFAVLIGLFVFTVVIGQQAIFSKRYDIRFRFTEVMGLRDGDNIVVRGMPVGKVDILTLKPDGVVVHGLLEQPLVIHEGYRSRIVTTSILGGRYLELVDGPTTNPLVAADTILAGDTPIDLMRELQGAITDIRSALNEGGIITNIQVAVADIREIAEKLSRGEGTLGKLINDDSVYKDFQAIGKDVREAAASFNEIAGKLKQGEGTLGKLLTDDTVYKDVQKVAANLKEISDRLIGGEGTLGKLFSKDDQLYQDISAAANSIKEIAGRMERGEGLLGKISKDEDLYHDAKAAMNDFRAVLDDYRENSPVVSFVSILFSAF